MSEIMNRFISATLPLTKSEVAVVPPPPKPTLSELATEINADYADLSALALTAVEKAIAIGKRLSEAKTQLSHGEFSGYVTSNFPFTLRWGQQCRKLAEHEPEIRQELERLRSIGSHLSLAKAFKLLEGLNPRPKVKRKKPKA